VTCPLLPSRHFIHCQGKFEKKLEKRKGDALLIL
jgi:hypothetical protein